MFWSLISINLLVREYEPTKIHNMWLAKIQVRKLSKLFEITDLVLKLML